MADWRLRSTISSDVVFFKYVAEGIERSASEVFVWDLDKTYLDTSWGSVRELLQTVLERAFHKKNIPGTRTLVQLLSQSWVSSKGSGYFPLYFITATPPQMEERIIEKLTFDDMHPFGCFFKDNLQNLRPGRVWRLTKQVGFKLHALLLLRARLHPEVRQVFWGDDSEADAIIYNLYSDICARRLGPNDVRHILKSLYVVGEQTDAILHLQSQIPPYDPVDKIYINLAEDTDPDYYLKFGRRTVPTSNTFQTALDLLQDGRLPLPMVCKVAQDMVENYEFTMEELTTSFDEMIRRQVIAQSTVEQAIPVFKDLKILSPDYEPSLAPVRMIERAADGSLKLEGVFEPWVPDRIDYLHDYR